MAIKVYILKKAIMKSSVDEYLALKAEAKEKKKLEKQMNPENPIEQKQKKDLRAVFVSTSDTALQALEIAGVSYEGDIDLEDIEFCKVAANEKGSRITKAWEKSVIKNRTEVFENMNCSYEYDQNFFVRNAAPAEWNEKGYFNLISGKHRATFFIAKGQNAVPLNICEEDFQKWINIDGYISYLKLMKI